MSWVAPYAQTLRERSAERVAEDPSCGWTLRVWRLDIARLKENLTRKSISLNEAERRSELSVDKARREQHRLQNLAAARAQPKSYSITLENASRPGLPAPQPTGNREPIGAAAGDSNAEPVEHPAVDPLLQETELILRDYTQLLGTRATLGVADSG